MARLVSELRDDEHNAIDGGISMKCEVLEADLVEQSVHIMKNKEEPETRANLLDMLSTLSSCMELWVR